ncbi:DNA polymerase delta subunit 2-like [Chrysoperla carnea]|uniref:DNA polymerase delta subunit 2-like n=1 Tax=Chrysoperla carnea TaxID=189513 RepID=UPI001D086F51|nr:DNA polymerase delta subunit 2-like [Chrysoperla carnea]
MPVKTENSEEMIRKECKYSNLSTRFKPSLESFTKQYYHIYLTRLIDVKNRLLERIEKKWGKKYPICELANAGDQPGLCIVLGTIYKEQKLKPSILKEIAEESQLIPQPIRTHFTDDSDVLILENEQQRVQLHEGLSAHDIVTGVPCAILGSELSLGQFKVEEYVFVDCSEQIERPIFNDDRFVVFISGIDMANQTDSLMALQLFIDWVIGLSANKDQLNEVSKICRVIIVGNSIRASADNKVKKSLLGKGNETDETINAVKLFDQMLSELVQCVPVDIMPGEFDPTNYMLPQQPMHYCMYPQSSKFTTIQGVTNPYEFELDGFKFLGTSGQPIQSILSYSNIEDPLEALQRCVQWGHLCPTAPDTLSCYPYYSKDPFIIKDCPHTVFAGNQAKYQNKIYKGPENQEVQLICVPEFAKTQTVAVLNLKTFTTYPVSFQVGL